MTNMSMPLRITPRPVKKLRAAPTAKCDSIAIVNAVQMAARPWSSRNGATGMKAPTAVGAFIPVAPFLLLQGRAAIWTAFTIAMLSHFAVGAARSFFTGRGVIRSGIDMFVIGVGVAAVGYFVGDLIAKLL